MQKLTDDQIEILKELWDRTIRPEGRMSRRTDISRARVLASLNTLKSKRLVQPREKPGTWRITPEGEAFLQSHLRPWYQGPYGIVALGIIVAILGGVISGLVITALSTN